MGKQQIRDAKRRSMLLCSKYFELRASTENCSEKSHFVVRKVSKGRAVRELYFLHDVIYPCTSDKHPCADARNKH